MTKYKQRRFSSQSPMHHNTRCLAASNTGAVHDVINMLQKYQTRVAVGSIQNWGTPLTDITRMMRVMQCTHTHRLVVCVDRSCELHRLVYFCRYIFLCASSCSLFSRFRPQCSDRHCQPVLGAPCWSTGGETTSTWQSRTDVGDVSTCF